ncbi:NAD(P)/FAD-dependent oxidoreductase [Oceanicaulis alexandrii]|uniref:NAD(P)/FAD-dependent oxidoreductase n=1 Tax=Oceanicaulis alexandrii TaxID=153233 RepID=UPI0023534773|nr:FAD-dependent oxidoreductase [Oceanicaulis alexandrii]
MSPITPLHSRPLRIAVIGAGVSGLGAAWALRNVHDVTVFEKRDRLGGHANTVRIDYDGAQIDVDTGFIVFNPLNYPNLIALFEHLGVDSHRTDMSFGFSLDRRFEWSSNGLKGLFADPSNLFNLRYLGMLRDILTFNKAAQKDLETGGLEGLSLGQYLDRLGMGDAFRSQYLLPMGAAIWSTSEAGMSDYPAETFVRFFKNHRLMHASRPKWNTVKGGSRTYVQKLEADLIEAGVEFQPQATALRRTTDGVTLEDENGKTHQFDEVILACHSDQALSLLTDADEDERQLLGAIRYGANEAVLHCDTSLTPARRGAQAAWTYLREGGDEAAVTYDMNRLQGIRSDRPLFVTLNPVRQPRPETVFGRYQYDHPQFNAPALAAQRIFNSIQGVRKTWFAGAWLGYGFHEDGLRAGLRVALRLGGQIPWSFAEGDVDGGAWARPAEPSRLKAHVAAE